MAQPVRTSVHVRIEAPRQLAWDTLTDIELQPAWMLDARSVDLIEGDELGPGARLRVPTRMLGMGFTDVMEVTAFEPPRRWEINHSGPFRGRGEFTLVEEEDGQATTVYWTEELQAPLGLLGEFALTAVQSLIRRQFEADLGRLRRVVESEARRSEGA